MSLPKYFVGNKKTWNSAHVALSALIYLHCNSSTVFNGWFSWKQLVVQIKATFLTLCTGKAFCCCLFLAFCFPNQDGYHLKTHESLWRGLIRVFGAVFPCVCLEAKAVDGPGNGVFGGALWRRAVSTAAAAGPRSETWGQLREQEWSKARRRESTGSSGLFCRGRKPLSI